MHDFVTPQAELRERMIDERDERGAIVIARCGEHKAREGAVGRSPERLAAGIIDLDVPAFELGADAAGEIAVGRDQRASRVGHLQRLAHTDRQRQRFFSLMRGFDDSDAVECRRERVAEGGLKFAPMVGRVGGTQRFGNEARARGERRRRRAEFDHIASRNAEHRDQPLQCCLRMTETALGAVRARVGDLGPGLVVHVAVEARQHDRALRVMRDCGEQLRRRFIGAGGTHGDHRTGRCAGA